MAEKIVVVVTKRPVEIVPGTVKPVDVKPLLGTPINVEPGEKSSVNVLPAEKTVTDLTVVAQQGPPGAKGINWRGKWDASTYYAKDDAVEYDGSAYIAKVPSIGVPPTDTTKWDTLATVEDADIDGGQW